MYELTSPEVIENSRKRREWEKAHPDQNWKTDLSEERIQELIKQNPEIDK